MATFVKDRRGLNWNEKAFSRERVKAPERDYSYGDEKKIYVTVPIDAILRNTQAATRVGIDDREVSIPHSVIEGGAPDEDDESITSLQIEEWFAIKKGLI